MFCDGSLCLAAGNRWTVLGLTYGAGEGIGVAPFAEALEGRRFLVTIRLIIRAAITPTAAKPATLPLINCLYPSLANPYFLHASRPRGRGGAGEGEQHSQDQSDEHAQQRPHRVVRQVSRVGGHGGRRGRPRQERGVQRRG